MPMEPSGLYDYTGDQEYMECVRDILEHPVFQSMDQYIQHGTTTCKAHCIQVSYLGYKLCKRFGGNCFYTIGIHMPGRRGSISMDLPIPKKRSAMQGSILN